MKVYLIMHKGKIHRSKIECWVDIEKISENEISVKSVKAFLEKKDAKEWLKGRGYDHLIIRTAEIK